jgi:hypothetical protein
MISCASLTVGTAFDLHDLHAMRTRCLRFLDDLMITLRSSGVREFRHTPFAYFTHSFHPGTCQLQAGTLELALLPRLRRAAVGGSRQGQE